MNPILAQFEKTSREEKKGAWPSFQAGDTINIHVKIKEGGKERIQQFQGIVIQRRHPHAYGETFTVRKLSGDVGISRVFPLYSPHIEKIEVLRRGKVRRARLFYLRGRTGKAARVKEKTQHASPAQRSTTS